MDYVCATNGCSEAFAGVCDEPTFCSVCGEDLTPLPAVTWLGHERNMGPVFAAFERAQQRAAWAKACSVEQQVRAFLSGLRPPIPTEATLAQIAEEYRRRGVPAVRARFEEDAIVVEVARPAGYG